jgi:glycosyltransferase involved in cell wall biosynthesis
MTLDVVIPTLNRCNLLAAAIDSLLAAPRPGDLHVTVTVVDNGSSDNTRAVAERAASSPSRPVRYLLEATRGQAHALNSGIAATRGELVGLVDDDETVGESWYSAVWREFQDPGIDFIGGPYIPALAAPPPAWLPRHKVGVVGWSELSPTRKRYGDELPGASLGGGNAVMRRSLLDRVGPYRTDLRGHHDTEMFDRFLSSGAHGVYVPDLFIHHHIPASRLQKSYFRRWVWTAGLAYACMGKEEPRSVLGIPAHAVRKVGERALRTSIEYCTRPSGVAAFEAELDFRNSVAFACGCFQYRNQRRLALHRGGQRTAGPAERAGAAVQKPAK